MAILVNLLTLGAHGSAMAATSNHSSSGMSHGTVNSLSCISICTASTPEKLREVEVDNEKDDDDRTPLFYVSDQQTIGQIFYEKHSQETKVATGLRPPPGPPEYVMNSVLRF